MFRGGNKKPKSPKAATKNPANAINKPGASTATAQDASNSASTTDERHRSYHLAFVFPAFEQFPLEFEAMRNIVSEIQQYCFEMNMDVECTTYISESERQLSEFSLLMELISEPQTTVICFIGDKYGNYQLPLVLQQQEFNAIRAAAVEFSKDIKLLEQYYCAWKNGSLVEYHLNCSAVDKAVQGRLDQLIQTSLKRAVEDGSILQINDNKPSPFTSSFIEQVAHQILSAENASKHIFVLRKFKDYEPSDDRNVWKDVDKKRFENVSTLKNLVSEKAVKRLSYMPAISKGIDPGRWLTGKDASVYERQLTFDLITAIKELIIPMERQTNSRAVSAMEMAIREEKQHEAYCTRISPHRWISRNGVDDKMNSIIQRGLEKSVCAQFYGGHGSGKTALICRLSELLQTKNCYVITRFAHLTDSAIFANELFKNIFLRLSQLAQQDTSQLAASFHLSSILSQAKLLMDKIDKPVFLLIDGANYVKFGRTLSQTEKPLRKLFPKLSLIYTSISSDAILSAFPPPEDTLELKPLEFESCMEILKVETVRNGCGLSSDQLTVLRQHLNNDENCIAEGQIKAFELLSPNPVLFTKLNQYLDALEKEYGSNVVRNVCQLLVVSPHGLTTAEISDGYRLANFQSGAVTKLQELFLPLPIIVLRRLAPLLVEYVADGRRVYRMRYFSHITTIRQRYIPSAGDLVHANEIAAELFKIGPNLENLRTNNQSAGIINFPPVTTKDAKSLRRLRYSWYYLLHSANIDELKSEALCAFEYIESVFRFFGLTRLLTIFEECLQQVLHHDLLVLFEQILLPAIPTLIYDGEQFVSEFINRLRYTRGVNSTYLNELIEQAMLWTDFYTGALLVPMTCWVQPPKMKQIISFNVPFNCTKPVLHPTCNHQHLLIAGDNSSPGSIYMYHIASQILFKTFKGHTDRVTSFCTSSDGTFFTSTSWDCSVRIWSILQLECTKTIKWNNSKILCSVLSEDNRRLITGSADSTARIIDLESGKTLKSFPDHTGPVVDLCLMSKDDLLVTGSGDFAVMVWSVDTGAVIIKMSGLMAPVTCLTVTSNDAFLAVACEDETLRVFSTVSAQELHELSGHDSRVNALCASIDDCKLFAATSKKIICYDIHNGIILETLECSLNLPVTSLKISDDNAFLLAGCGNRVHIWDVNSIENKPVVNNSAALVCVELSTDERTATCGTEDGVLAVWDLDACRCLWTTSQQKSGPVTALCFTNDSLSVISGSSQGSVSLWEASNGALMKSFELHQTKIVSIICFSDGNNVLTCDDADTAYIWAMSSVEDPSQIEILSNFTGLRAPLFLRLGDTTLVSHNSSNLKELNIWSHYDAVFTAKTKAHHTDEILCYHVNRVGTFLVTGSVDQSLKVWKLETGFLTQVLVGHEDVVLCCSIAEDGKTVVSGGRDSLVIIWDAETGQSKLQYTAKAPVTAVKLTHDSSIVISADELGWIEAHYMTRNQRLSSFNAHRSVQQLIISLEAHRILARLSNTAQLPILCLHNTPAAASSSVRNDRHRLHTLMSTTSLTNGGADETGSLADNPNSTNHRASIVDASNNANISVIKAPPPAQNNGTTSSANKSDQNNNADRKSIQKDKSSGSNGKAQPKRSRTCTLL